MNVVAKSTLVAFWTKHPQARAPLVAWFVAAKRAEWKDPQDIKSEFGSADFVANNRVVFNIGGNNYRLVARISYRVKQVLIKFVGTHKEYDAINAETI